MHRRQPHDVSLTTSPNNELESGGTSSIPQGKAACTASQMPVKQLLPGCVASRCTRPKPGRASWPEPERSLCCMLIIAPVAPCQGLWFHFLGIMQSSTRCCPFALYTYNIEHHVNAACCCYGCGTSWTSCCRCSQPQRRTRQ